MNSMKFKMNGMIEEKFTIQCILLYTSLLETFYTSPLKKIYMRNTSKRLKSYNSS